MNETKPAHPSLSGPGSAPAERARVIDVAALLGADREAIILHNGERYRLRVTQNGKLILTK